MSGHRRGGIREVLLVARVWAFVSLLSVLVRLCSVPRLLRLCALGAPRPPADAARIVACVERVLARHPVISRSPCLKRSLTLYRFLGARATNVQFCLGVRYANTPHPRRTRQIQGHAWLLRNGMPYLERNHLHVRRFRVIYRYPARERSVA
jgi:transglutaminase superfamily protein